MSSTKKSSVKKVSLKKSNLKKALVNSNRRIARANKAFEKMSPAEKRVQIARDVLAQLAMKRLVPTEGIWLNGTNSERGDLFVKTDIKKNPELKDLLKKRKTCHGCALGGMFMCSVERADKLKVRDLITENEPNFTEDELIEFQAADCSVPEGITFDYLEKFFDMEQLEMIESAFERGAGVCHYNSASAFANVVEDPGTRMELIMQNIIVNKGKFVPSKKFETEIKYHTPGFTG